MIALENIFFSYHSSADRGVGVLRDLSFVAEDGRCTVLAGENGSGKSTALAIAAGILKPLSGRVIRKGTLGYVPQDSALFDDMTVLDNLRFFSTLTGTQLPSSPDALPFGISEFLRKRVSELSGGMKKRVSLACTLISSPQNILLDEPHAALDATYRKVLSDTISRLCNEGRCVVYVGHREDEYSSFCGSRYLIEDGRAIPFHTEKTEKENPQ